MSLALENLGLVDGGVPVITDVSLTLERGSMNVLLGLTLAGKTTLMRLMAGLDRPSSGRPLFDGKDITGVPVRRRSVAMIYQQFVNYPTLSVYENIASPLRVAKVPAAEIEARVQAAAKLLRH
jgi:glycerol transport system ATP-binding protein